MLFKLRDSDRQLALGRVSVAQPQADSIMLQIRLTGLVSGWLVTGWLLGVCSLPECEHNSLGTSASHSSRVLQLAHALDPHLHVAAKPCNAVSLN